MHAETTSVALPCAAVLAHGQAGQQTAATTGSLHGILSPVDELQYWADQAASAGAGVPHMQEGELHVASGSRAML